MCLDLIAFVGETTVTTACGLLALYFSYKFVSRVARRKRVRGCETHCIREVTNDDIMPSDGEEEDNDYETPSEEEEEGDIKVE